MELGEYLSYLRAYKARLRPYFVRMKDYYRYAPCHTAPEIDPRSLINCCPSSVRCPLRDVILFTLSGLEYTEENYRRLMRRYDEYKQKRGSFNVRGFFRYIP